MNKMLNPLYAFPLLKRYLFDINRIKRSNKKQIQKYRNKAFRSIVKYAYDVPVYNKKYKEAGIRPEDISGIKDAHKIPLMSKQELINSSLDNLVPKNYSKKNASVVSTSGSSGNPISFYLDFPTMSTGTLMLFRALRSFDLNLFKINFACIGNFTQGKTNQVFEDALSKDAGFLIKNNHLSLNAFDDMQKIIKNLNKNKPDVLMSYPVTLQQLAHHKKKGHCENINPKIILVGGYEIDDYTKNYIRDAFDCYILDMYSTAEAAAVIACECSEEVMHINQDYFHIEAIDEKENPVFYGEKGRVVMTRLYGRGTPFVRYTGLNDYVTIESDYSCKCGLCTDVFKNGVEGRKSTSVILPDGRIYPSASFAIISVVLKKLNTYKVKQFQIIQNKIDDIEIRLVFDSDLKNQEPSEDLIISKIKEAYLDLVGPGVSIKIKEVKEIKHPPGKPPPLVISKLNMKNNS